MSGAALRPRKKSLPLARFCLILVVLLAGLAWLVMQPVSAKPPAAALPDIDAHRLQAHVRMLSETLHPRSYLDTENLDKCADYIEGVFAASGGRVSRQYYTVRGRNYCNVIASYGPEAGPLVVIGAHYDSDGGEESGSHQTTPGADDNASGVAGLLALAEAFGAAPPPGRMELVAYCLEEPPFFETIEMGSYPHALSLHEKGEEVLGVIVLEMIGYFTDEPDSQKYPVPGMDLFYPTTGNFVGIVGRVQDYALTRTVKAAMLGADDLPVYSANALACITGVDYSDHRNYWPFGYSAVMITDLAFFRNKGYHQQHDTHDTLDYKRMAKLTRGVYAAALELAHKGPAQ